MHVVEIGMTMVKTVIAVIGIVVEVILVKAMSLTIVMVMEGY